MGALSGRATWSHLLRWNRAVAPYALTALFLLSSAIAPLPLAHSTPALASQAASTSTHASPSPTLATSGPSSSHASSPVSYFGGNPSSEPAIPAAQSGQLVPRFPTWAPLTPVQRAAYGNVSIDPSGAQGTAFEPVPGQIPLAPTGPAPSSFSPLPLAPAQGLATAKGVLENTLLPHQPISGALVRVTPVGNVCQNQTCPPQTTNAAGAFTVTILAGADQLYFSADWYVDNYTTLTNVSAGQTYNLGIIYMVPDGVVCGTVVGNDSAHEPVVGAKVTGSTRDTKFIAQPTAITNSKGQFRAPVPPGPSELQITPPASSLYFGTTVYLDLKPGQSTNSCSTSYLNFLVELQVAVVVTMTPYNALTGAKITGGFGYWAAKLCSRNQPNLCMNQGPAVGLGQQVKADAPVGADTLNLMASGFMLNSTPVFVPQLSPGHVYNLGTVWLVPFAEADIYVGLTWPNAVKAAESKWGTGLVVTSACSLDGLQFSAAIQNAFFGINMTSTTCAGGGCSTGPGATIAMAVAPFRNSIHAFPDSNRYCYPYFSTWPIPGDLPVSDNYTWVNGTPGRIVTGYANLTPGTYIQGTVLPVQATGWTATDCSTDAVTQCWPAATTSGQYDINPLPAGCSNTGDMFCVPVVPGPSQISIVSTDYPQNYTAVYNPPGVWSQMPLPMGTASANRISAISLTSGIVQGHVLDALSHKPVGGLAAVQVKPAGLATTVTTETAANGAGFFSLNAAPGWESVIATAPNYVSNRTWVYVGSGTYDVGTIYLTPKSWIEGTVLGPTGYPINTTSVQVCPLVDPNGCVDVSGSSGLTNTNGTFWQLVVGDHLPIGAYRIVATAPGYLSNSTWVNVTAPNMTFVASTLYLRPLLGTPRALAPAGSGTGAVGAWIYGRVVDNDTGQGLPGAAIQVTPIGGGFPQSIGGITADGYFNFTEGLGQYWVNLTDTGRYYPGSSFVVVNGTVGAINLGTFRLVPYHYLAGRLVADPWRVPVSSRYGLGVVSNLKVCLANRTDCGGTGQSDISGLFNVSAPLGPGDYVSANALGTGLGMGGVGFLPNSTYFNVTKNNSAGRLTMGQIIYTAFAGRITDASTNNRSFVRWGTVSLMSFTPKYGPASFQETLSAGGSYVIFLPPGNITQAQAGGSSFVTARFNYTTNYTISQLENITPSVVQVIPDVALVHYGWIQFVAVASQLPFGESTARIPYATASANVTTRHAIAATSPPTTADGWGFVNMSAPPGTNVTLVVSGPDFNITTVYPVSVNQSETTFVNGTSFTALGNVTVVPWGWLEGVAYDPVAREGINAAGVGLSNNLTQTSAPGILANSQGTFFVDAPFSGPAFLAVTAAGYLANNSVVKIKPGALTSVGNVSLRGEGIVAGRVLGYPGLHALYQATVTVCPIAAPVCTSSNVTTNGTGYFWVAASPGLDVVNISLVGYAFNASSEELNVPSDQWIWAGTFVLNQYAEVTGTVLGSPSGIPLLAANVSMCSVLALPGSPTGPCFETVLTDTLGQFAIYTPPGTFIIGINATFYNATYIPITLTPGESVPLGTVFLQAYGAVVGTVLGEDTNAAVRGTFVQACPLWTAGNCTSVVGADSSGRFHLEGPPGGYLLVASAPGYQDRYVDASFVSGTTTTLPPIFLVPVGTTTLYTISGSVTGGPNLSPVAGAVISAGTNYATATDSGGLFTLVIPWGSYVLDAQAAGYFTASRPITVHGDQSGVDFVLTQAVFAVSGTTRDGLNGNPVPFVEIVSGGVIATTSDAVGSYSLLLPNGTYTLSAQPSQALAAPYALVSFTVSVTGSSQQRDIQLYLAQADLYGLAVNSVTGGPLENVSITITGTTSDSRPWSAHLITGPTGSFVAPLYVGQYTVSASAPGYVGSSRTVSPASANSLEITLGLTPVSTPATASTPLGWTPVFVVAGVAAVGIVTYLTLGRWRTAPASDASAPTPVPRTLARGEER